MPSAEPFLKPQSRSIEVIAPYRSKIAVSTREGYYLIDKSSIRFIEASNNYCYIHFNDSDKVLCSKPLKHYETKLNTRPFCKIHQSFLVNFNAIRFIEPSMNKVELEDGQVLSVSRSKKETLRHFLKTMFD